jgi:hypothetical protein
MIKLKAGVVITGIKPEISLAIAIAKSVYDSCDEPSMTITSVIDGKHRKDSLHYKGLAIDLRLPISPMSVMDKLRVALGNSYDVILEKDHIHIEYDPADSLAAENFADGNKS